MIASNHSRRPEGPGGPSCRSPRVPDGSAHRFEAPSQACSPASFRRGMAGEPPPAAVGDHPMRMRPEGTGDLPHVSAVFVKPFQFTVHPSKLEEQLRSTVGRTDAEHLRGLFDSPLTVIPIASPELFTHRTHQSSDLPKKRDPSGPAHPDVPDHRCSRSCGGVEQADRTANPTPSPPPADTKNNAESARRSIPHIRRSAVVDAIRHALLVASAHEINVAELRQGDGAQTGRRNLPSRSPRVFVT